jgi:uncharacterized metal-binding protein YceD (DUF177 family)
MSKVTSPWSVPVAVEDIPEAGLHLVIEAPATARAELAALAGVREVPQVSAVFDLARQGEAVQVTGEVKAKVGQICVVSLEPIETEVAEAVDLRFIPVPAGAAAEPGKLLNKVSKGEEPPEPLVEGKVDLGQLATEFLMLGIDPYPRKEGVQFAALQAEDGGEHPFAVLESLKKQLSGGKS